MKTEFYISESRIFIKEHMLKYDFPFPIGINDQSQLKKIIENSSPYSFHDFYFYADDKALPLQLGDKVILGKLHWKVIERTYNYDTSTLRFKLEQD